MSWFDDIVNSTESTLYEAVTGNVSPQEKADIISAGAAAEVQASGGTETLAQATIGQSNIVNVALSTSSQGDANPSDSSCSGFSSILSDPFGCISVPSWLKWTGIAVAVLAVLFVLGPYAGLLKRNK